MELPLDDLVALSPLLLAAAVLLFGYAGCEFTPGTVSPPPPPTPTLTFRARVPTGITVIQVAFGWESPSTPRQGAAVNTPTGTDGADNLFEHTLADPALEAWTVRCEVRAQGGPTETPVANGMFTLDGSIEDVVVTFQAAAPTGPTSLTVTYIG